MLSGLQRYTNHCLEIWAACLLEFSHDIFHIWYTVVAVHRVKEPYSMEKGHSAQHAQANKDARSTLLTCLHLARIPLNHPYIYDLWNIESPQINTRDLFLRIVLKPNSLYVGNKQKQLWWEIEQAQQELLSTGLTDAVSKLCSAPPSPRLGRFWAWRDGTRKCTITTAQNMPAALQKLPIPFYPSCQSSKCWYMCMCCSAVQGLLIWVDFNNSAR